MPAIGAWAERHAAAAVFLFALLAYLLTAPGHLHTIDMTSELLVARSMVLHGNFVVPYGQALHGVGGQRVSQHDLGASLFLLPAALAGLAAGSAGWSLVSAWAASISNILAAAATITLFYRLLRDLPVPPRAALSTTLLLGFSTMLWSYAHDAFDIVPTTTCLLLTVYALHRSTHDPRPRWPQIAALALAGAILLRVTSLIWLPPCALYMLLAPPRRSRAAAARVLLLWTAPILGACLCTAWFNWVRFGGPLRTGYELIPQNGFSHPILAGVLGLLVSPGKSVFLFSPTLLLALLGLPAFLRRFPALGALVLTLALSTILFYARFDDWSGDWAWGPRYLVPIVPLLFLPAAYVLASWSALSRPRRRACAALIALAVLVQISSVSVDYQVEMELVQHQGKLAAMYWTPRYAQLTEQVLAAGRLLRGAPEALPAVHTRAIRHASPVEAWDLWWLRAWRTGGNRVLIAALLLALLAALAASGAWLARLFTRDRGQSPVQVRSRPHLHPG